MQLQKRTSGIHFLLMPRKASQHFYQQLERGQRNADPVPPARAAQGTNGQLTCWMIGGGGSHEPAAG